jgi:hypothetical protein
MVSCYLRNPKPRGAAQKSPSLRVSKAEVRPEVHRQLPNGRERTTDLAAHSLAPEPLAAPARATSEIGVPPVGANGGSPAAGAPKPILQPNSTPPASLRLRIIRGRLALSERTRILSEYNRLTGNRVAVQQFRRWTEESASGPALHAFLETTDGRIACHCALIPFPLGGPDGALTVAKEHYLFLSEQYRSQPVDDFRASKKSPAEFLLEELRARASQQGWNTILACPPPQLEPMHDAVGYRAVDFTVRNCFFLLNPARGWQTMRHLPLSTRTLFSAAGAGSWAYAACVSPFRHRHGLVQRSRITDIVESPNGRASHRLSLSEDPAFLCWRYPESSYARLAVGNNGGGYVIVARGLPFSFTRVCQFRTPSLLSIHALAEELIRDARATHALGVRWSVYGDGPEQDRLVAELRKHMFFSIRRERRILVSSSDPQLLSPANWNLSDSLFTFDL